MEQKARVDEQTVRAYIFFKYMTLQEAIEEYDRYEKKRVSPVNEWPKVMVALSSFARILEPYLIAGYPDYKTLFASIDNCRTYKQLLSINRELSLFCYNLGITKIDNYKEPQKKGLTQGVTL